MGDGKKGNINGQEETKISYCSMCIDSVDDPHRDS